LFVSRLSGRWLAVRSLSVVQLNFWKMSAWMYVVMDAVSYSFTAGIGLCVGIGLLLGRHG
jgi:hypothetical protein